MKYKGFLPQLIITLILTFWFGLAQSQCDPATCEGDLNCDEVVGTGDLLIILEAWGLDSVGDINGDGVTGFDDLAIFLSHYGVYCDEINN